MSRVLRLGVPAAVVAVGLVGAPALALHRDSPPSVRFTSGNDHALPVTRSWNRFLAFTSENDLLGNGSTGRQVFVFGQFAWVCKFVGQPQGEAACPNPPEPYMFQVTSGIGDPDNPSATRRPSDKQMFVAFDAYGSFSGMTGAAASHRQIYVKNVTTGQLLTLTMSPDGDNVKPTISGGGGFVVFESTAQSVTLFPSGTSQIVAIDFAGTNTFPKYVITGGTSNSTNPTTNSPGNLVAFESTADLVPGSGVGCVNGTCVKQIFTADVDRAHPPLSTVHQITAGDAMSRRPYLSDAGGIVAFESTATNFPDAPGGPGIQIYTATITGSDFPPITRRTDANAFGDCTWPALDADTPTRIAMICTGDPLQNGTTGNRAFVLDFTQNPPLYQLNAQYNAATGRGGDVQGPIGHSFGNYFATLSTTEDMSGTGGCNHQLQLVDYFPGSWSAATLLHQAPFGAQTVGNPNAACDDGSLCTSDTCDTDAHTCSYGAATGGCDDHNPCTTGDACQAGVCVGGAPRSCNDNNVCTNDACNPAAAPNTDPCTHTNNTNPCSDGDLCTTGDVCANGSCHGAPVVCSDPNVCDGLNACNPATGQCQAGAAPDCDDHNPCTDDSCDPQGGCVHVNNTAPCDDGNACTLNDVCAAGACRGGTPKCDDHDSCTIDVCSGDGSCNHDHGVDFMSCEVVGIRDQLDSLSQRIGSLQASTVGGNPRQKRLKSRVEKARKLAGQAIIAPDARIPRFLKQIDKLLKSFATDIDKAGPAIDPAVASDLKTQVAAIRTRIQAALHG